MRIIDAHIHLGNRRETKYYSLGELRKDLEEAGAQGAVVFPFPEDIYRVTDTVEARVRANKYVLETAKASKDMDIYPFYFVWKDYLIPDDLEEYVGVKWHRHFWNEPRYDYDDPRCHEFLKRVKELGMPICLEEGFEETLRFVKDNPDLDIIIPHMGKLNGGYDKMNIFYDNPRVYFDTSTAEIDVIRRVLERVGPKRVIFGSDVSGTKEPFYNFPKVELAKIMKLDLKEEELELILAANIETLIAHR